MSGWPHCVSKMMQSIFWDTQSHLRHSGGIGNFSLDEAAARFYNRYKHLYGKEPMPCPLPVLPPSMTSAPSDAAR